LKHVFDPGGLELRHEQRAAGAATSRIAAAGASVTGASDCAIARTAAVLIPSALNPVMSWRRDIPSSRYCLISSFMEFSSAAPVIRLASIDRS
jgi:hypothetical protein